ncbi:MAG: acetyltransferase [Psychroserpens sp.]|uniref:acetyltransferase n=1 Tax=Psychroserpens sp. TaxID=2020870 RepID=UPI003C77FDAD
MPNSQAYYTTYQHLPEKLAETYPNLRFDNHCYLRIALDNTFQAKWDTVIDRPAYKTINPEQKATVLKLLNSYLVDRALLMSHNRLSLTWRNKI